MAFSISTFRTDGSPKIDSLTTGGILIDVITISALTTGSKAYPNVSQVANLTWALVSGGGLILSASFNGVVTLNWTYSAGTPNYDSVYFVFASNVVNSDPFGALLVNDAGQQLADQGYPSPQYVGQMALSSTPAAAYQTPDGYKVAVHSSASTDLRAGANKMVLMNLPDVGTDDTWYALRKEYIKASEGAVVVSVAIYTKASTYKLPSIHVYALDQPLVSSDPFSFQIRDSTGKLTFDTGAECLTNRTALSITYPSYGGATSSYNLSFINPPGVCLPSYTYSNTASDGTHANRYSGVAKRVGLQVTTNTLFDYQTTSTAFNGGTNHDSSLTGNQSGRYCATADITYQSPSATVLTTPSTFSVPPVIVGQPPDVYGGSQVYTITTQVDGTAPFTYQWYKNGVAVAGATSQYFSFTPAAGDNSMPKYYCIASNAVGWVRSRDATYYLDTSTPPTITNLTYPSGNVDPGTSVTVSFTASGSPTPACTLYLGSTSVATGSGSASYTFTTTSGATYNFQAHAVVTGETRSRATDSYFTVTTGQPDPVQLVSSPQSTSVQAGSVASFTVTVSGAAPYYYSWFKNGQGIGPAAAQSNSTSNTLNYTTSSADNGATFHCIVNNYANGQTFQYSAQSADATLTVTSASSGTPTAPSPVFSTNPSGVTLTAGQTASFSCAASPATSYQWYKNGSAVSGATGTSYSFTTTSGDSGTSVYVVATNAPAGYIASSTSSSTATVTIQSATATFSSYGDMTGYVDNYSAPSSFAVYNDGSSDGGTWGYGSGDGTLYDVMATSSNYDNLNTTGYFGVGVWYSFAQFSGVGWGINPSGATGNISSCSLSISVRLRASGQIVAGGSVTLRTQNGGVQA